MRHGQPQLDLETMKKHKVSPDGIGKIVANYEITDLNTDSTPPAKAVTIAKSCDAIFSSDLPRAVASIELLGVQDKIQFDADFRESSLPYLNWKKPKLSLYTWFIIFRLFWLCGFSKNGESLKTAKRRTDLAVNKLLALAKSNESILLLGHGIINRLVANNLKQRGWKKIEKTNEHYWSYTIFQSPS